MYDAYHCKDIVKMAIVSGRALYKEEWGLKENGKPIFIDLEQVYECIESFTQTLESMGFSDVVKLVDPTYDLLNEAFLTSFDPSGPKGSSCRQL